MIVAAMAVGVTAEQTGAVPPTIDQLKNATYKGIYDQPVTLRDTTYEGTPYRPDSQTRPRAGLLAATLVTGDLTGDGAPEAVVLVWKASGGSGVFTYVAVAASRAGTVENIATALVGDRVQVQSLSIAGTRVVVDIVGLGPGEALCCPTQRQRRSWELTGTGLKELPTQVLGPVRLADLEGKTWTLKSLDSDTPVPDGVTVTLTVKDARAAGSAGCNSYSGAIAAGDGARSLKIGPLSSTRKFCDDPAGVIEAKYLAGLEGAFLFGFRAGDLALTYRIGEEIKTLIYSAK